MRAAAQLFEMENRNNTINTTIYKWRKIVCS
jgi:hypothetical protein